MTRGEPTSPSRYTCKSTTTLAAALVAKGHEVSPSTVGRLLKIRGYSLQGNRKAREGTQHPDRNAQLEHINTRVRARQRRGEPVISVDTKKKESAISRLEPASGTRSNIGSSVTSYATGRASRLKRSKLSCN